MKSKKSVGAEVTMDRRRKDRRANEPEATVAVRPKLERRVKVNRRRQIDPTTCERDYTDDEVEFMRAMDEYKRSSGRMFPTCSEILEVLRNLGYVKGSGPQALPTEPTTAEPTARVETLVTELETVA